MSKRKSGKQQDSTVRRRTRMQTLADVGDGSSGGSGGGSGSGSGSGEARYAYARSPASVAAAGDEDHDNGNDDDPLNRDLFDRRYPEDPDLSPLEGGTKEPRRFKTIEQRVILERWFNANDRPTDQVLIDVAADVGLTVAETARWYRNRRHRPLSARQPAAVISAAMTPAVPLPVYVGMPLRTATFRHDFTHSGRRFPLHVDMPPPSASALALARVREASSAAARRGGRGGRRRGGARQATDTDTDADGTPGGTDADLRDLAHHAVGGVASTAEEVADDAWLALDGVFRPLVHEAATLQLSLNQARDLMALGIDPTALDGAMLAGLAAMFDLHREYLIALAVRAQLVRISTDDTAAASMPMPQYPQYVLAHQRALHMQAGGLTGPDDYGLAGGAAPSDHANVYAGAAALRMAAAAWPAVPIKGDKLVPGQLGAPTPTPPTEPLFMLRSNVVDSPDSRIVPVDAAIGGGSGGGSGAGSAGEGTDGGGGGGVDAAAEIAAGMGGTGTVPGVAGLVLPVAEVGDGLFNDPAGVDAAASVWRQYQQAEGGIQQVASS